ncbi:MAG: sterol desaturase family protein [Sandaracinaceae bacterium]
MSAPIIALAIPAFFVAIGLELAVAARRGLRDVYRTDDAINSLSCGVTQQVAGLFLKLWVIGAYVAIHAHLRLFDLDGGSVLVWVLGALAVDLLYYAFHRASHRVNAIWAPHVVRHQSEAYNLTTALRQGAFQGLMSAVFYWPLAVLGLPPAVFIVVSTLNTLYQFWIHTRLIGRLGPLEWVLNTPSHHRVHHGIDPEYLDRNYAGILIIWDRLFGTFQPERQEPSYGTVRPLRSWNPLWAQVEAWAYLWRMARRTRRWRDRLAVCIMPPEWRPADLGGPVALGPVSPDRPLYRRTLSPALRAYVLTQFVAIGLATVALLVPASDDPHLASALPVSAWILAALIAWGGLFEGRPWARRLECARLLATPLALLAASAALPARAASLGWAIALSAAYAGVSLAGLARLRPARAGAPYPTSDRPEAPPPPRGASRRGGTSCRASTPST